MTLAEQLAEWLDWEQQIFRADELAEQLDREQAMTKAEEFTTTDLLVYDFDPAAEEDQIGEIHVVRFNDGSKLFINPTTGEEWTSET